MHRILERFRNIPWPLWLLLLLVACSSAKTTSSFTPVEIPKATNTLTAIIPTKTNTRPPTVTPRPSATPTSTKSATPSPTATLPPPSPTPSATNTASTPDCWGMGGRIEIGQLTTPILPNPLEYRIYLPPCYDQQSESRYPVLYLIHGQNYTDDQWDRLGADETATRLIMAGDLPPFLMVMPRDRVWSQPTDDHFGQAVTDALIPWIDTNYRTRADRKDRAVGGLSRGGAWAVHLGLSRWELFGVIGAHSLTVFWNDVGRIEGWLDAIPGESFPRIYLDIGDRDRPEVVESATWFEGLLDARGLPHEWHTFAGTHEEAYWQAHVEQYLLWYGAEWRK